MKKIAIPVTQNNQIDEHFGHCDFFNVYTISDTNEVSGVTTIQSEQGCGCKSNIAQTLSSQGVSLMLAGGMGEGAINVLSSWGISVIRGCSGNAADSMNDYLAGNLQDSGPSCHHHADGHQCQH